MLCLRGGCVVAACVAAAALVCASPALLADLSLSLCVPGPFIHQVACEELEEGESEQEGFVNYARRVGRRIVALESIGQHGTWEAYQRKPKEEEEVVVVKEDEAMAPAPEEANGGGNGGGGGGGLDGASKQADATYAAPTCGDGATKYTPRWQRKQQQPTRHVRGPSRGR